MGITEMIEIRMLVISREGSFVNGVLLLMLSVFFNNFRNNRIFNTVIKGTPIRNNITRIINMNNPPSTFYDMMLIDSV